MLLAGFGGLYVARLVEYGSPSSRLAFTCACLVWLLTGSLPYLRVRQHRFRDHERCTVRNHAMTVSFPTHSVWVAALVAAFPPLGLGAEARRAAGDWLTFSFKLLVAEVLVIRRLLCRLLRRPRGATAGEPVSGSEGAA